MKKTALFIMVCTVSTPIFACWGGSHSGFWDDGVLIAITPILKKVKGLKKTNTISTVPATLPTAVANIPTVPATVTSGSWGTFLEFIKVSYLTNLIPKH